MALPIKDEGQQNPRSGTSCSSINTRMIKNQPKKSSLPINQKLDDTCLEALLGCTILAKLNTIHGDQFRCISEPDVLNVIEALRANQISVTNSGGSDVIKMEVGKNNEARQVTMRLRRGSIKALLATRPELVSGDQLKFACEYINSGTVKHELLKLRVEDRRVKSCSVLSSRSLVDLVLSAKSMLFN